MKKKVKYILSLILLLFLLVAGFAVYTYFLKPTGSLRPIYMVPDNAIYILETQKPISNWETISNHEVWKHLQQNDYIAELTQSANALDSLLKDNGNLLRLLDGRTVLISAHTYRKDDYDFLYVADLQKATHLLGMEQYLEALISNNYELSRRDYRDQEILELYDPEERETLYVCFIDNLLLATYRHPLIEAAIDQKDFPVIGRDLSFVEVSQQVRGEGMFRLYFNYDQLDEYLHVYLEEENAFVTDLSEWLQFSGLSYTMSKSGTLRLRGTTLINDSISSYLKASLQAGKGDRHCREVIPQRTALYLSLGFDRFSAFYDELELVMQQDAEKWTEFEKNRLKLERFLDINLREDFIEWVDDEIAFIQTKAADLGKENEFALILKAQSGETATEKLNFISQQIRKQTPVRFKEVTYEGYSIRFMSVKGFFRMLLGDFFAKLERPYYTIIDDFVIFSNHPQTLKSIIDDYKADLTLQKSSSYRSFASHFAAESNVYVYLQTPILIENMKGFLDEDSWADMQKNRPFIACFSDIGFQLAQKGRGFETRLITNYIDPEKLTTRELALNKPQTPLASTEEVTLGDMLVSAVEAFRQIDPDSLQPEEMVSVDEISIDDLDARKQQEFFADGSLKLEVSLKDGLKHGSYREYYESGNLKVKGKFRKDERTGLWRFYDEEGTIIRRERY